MNLEESNEYFQFQQKKNKKKKIILFFIIFLIILIIFLIISIVMLKKKDANTKKLFLNGNKINWNTSLFLNQDNKTYVSAPIIANLIGGEYIKGEYKTYTQDKDKCYIQTKYEIISISSNSKYVKKYLKKEDSVENNNTSNNQTPDTYVVNSEDDTMELVELESQVIFLNDTIYVPIENIEDVFNVDYSVTGNSIYIYTLDYLFNYAKNFVGSKNIPIISNTYENVKALLEDKVVVANQNNKYGVINLKNGETFISYQYSKIIYMQNSKEYFVYTDNSVGLLGADGNTSIIEPTKYDSISVFDEINKLYLAEKNEKYGILNVNGKVIVPTNFDVIGPKSIENYEEYEIPESETPNLLQGEYIAVSTDEYVGLYNVKGESLLKINYDGFGYLATSEDKENQIKNTLFIPKKAGLNGLIVKRKGWYGIYDFNLKDFVIPITLTKIYSRLDNDELDYFMLLGEEEIKISDYIKEMGLDYVEDDNESSKDKDSSSDEKQNDDEENQNDGEENQNSDEKYQNGDEENQNGDEENQNGDEEYQNDIEENYDEENQSNTEEDFQNDTDESIEENIEANDEYSSEEY